MKIPSDFFREFSMTQGNNLKRNGPFFSVKELQQISILKKERN